MVGGTRAVNGNAVAHDSVGAAGVSGVPNRCGTAPRGNYLRSAEDALAQDRLVPQRVIPEQGRLTTGNYRSGTTRASLHGSGERTTVGTRDEYQRPSPWGTIVRLILARWQLWCDGSSQHGSTGRQGTVFRKSSRDQLERNTPRVKGSSKRHRPQLCLRVRLARGSYAHLQPASDARRGPAGARRPCVCSATIGASAPRRTRSVMLVTCADTACPPLGPGARRS